MRTPSGSGSGETAQCNETSAIKKMLTEICRLPASGNVHRFNLQYMSPRVLPRTAALLLMFAGGAFATKKVVSPTQAAANDDVEVAVTLVLDHDEVVKKIGADPGPGIVLLEVRFSNKRDKPMQMSPDDFILLAHDDGERYHPFTPAEIAGKGGMVLKTQDTGTIGVNRTGPRITGLGLPIGTSSSKPTQAPGASTDKKDDSSGDKPQGATTFNEPLLTALKAKQLEAKDVTDTAEGYLYFPLDGKHKLKNMAVLYRTRGEKLDIEFEH